MGSGQLEWVLCDVMLMFDIGLGNRVFREVSIRKLLGVQETGRLGGNKCELGGGADDGAVDAWMGCWGMDAKVGAVHSRTCRLGLILVVYCGNYYQKG